MVEIIQNKIYFKFIKYCKDNNIIIREGDMTGNQAHFTHYLLSSPEIRDQLRMLGDLETVFITVQQFLKETPESECI